MKRIGLYPTTSTGQPGGKEVGQKVTHYIIDGGPFDLACTELIADGFVDPLYGKNYGDGKEE